MHGLIPVLRSSIPTGPASRRPFLVASSRLLHRLAVDDEAVAVGGDLDVLALVDLALQDQLGERVVADVRNAVYAKVVRMDPTFFEVTRTGEVLSRLTADTTLVQSISGVGISITLRSTLTLLGSLVMLVATSPMLTLMIVASFAYSVHLTSVDRTTAYFSPLPRASELAAGALLAVISPWLLKVPRMAGVAMSSHCPLLAIGPTPSATPSAISD